jgi:hypothetical protein
VRRGVRPDAQKREQALCDFLVRQLSSRPRVRRADRLDDVLEDGRRAQHAPGAERAPRQVVVADQLVEGREVLVEPEHVRDRLLELRREAARNGFDPDLLAVCNDRADRPERASHRVRGRRRPWVVFRLVCWGIGLTFITSSAFAALGPRFGPSKRWRPTPSGRKNSSSRCSRVGHGAARVQPRRRFFQRTGS